MRPGRLVVGVWQKAHSFRERQIVCRISTVLCSPDCGLKTREWNQVLPSIENMVKAAASMRATKA